MKKFLLTMIAASLITSMWMVPTTAQPIPAAPPATTPQPKPLSPLEIYEQGLSDALEDGDIIRYYQLLDIGPVISEKDLLTLRMQMHLDLVKKYAELAKGAQ